MEVFDWYRREGQRIDSFFFSRVSRVIGRCERPDRFRDAVQGYLDLSLSWARNASKEMKCDALSATTSRLQSPAEVVREGEKFYQAIAEYKGIVSDMFLNANDFFVFWVETIKAGLVTG